MTRLTQFLVALATGAAILVATWYGRGDLFPNHVKQVESILPLVPFWALVALGSYALINVGYALATFRDCDEAAADLSKELVRIKTMVQKQGFDVQ